MHDRDVTPTSFLDDDSKHIFNTDVNMNQEQPKIKANIVHQNLLRKRGKRDKRIAPLIDTRSSIISAACYSW